MQAENERRFDEYELMATQAMWNRAAYHAKRLKKSNLFKRQKDGEQVDPKTIEERRKEVDEMNDWLATLTVEREG